MQEPTASPSPVVRRLGVIDYLIFLAEHAKWLVILPLLATLVVYGLGQTKPKVYVSTALVLLPPDALVTPAQAAAVMRSDAVLERVRATRAATGATGAFAATTGVGKEGMIRLDVEAATSADAEAAAQAVLDAWLKTTAPGERDRVDLQARAARAKADLANVQAALEAVTKALTSGDRSGADGLLRLAALSDTADRMFRVVLEVNRRLDGMTSDVIKQSPTHAVAAPSRAATAAVKAAVASFAFLVAALLVLRRFLELRNDSVHGPKLRRLTQAFGRRKPGEVGSA